MEPSSSFHNVVSQASHLVEQVLQDHISDPEQMTQSLKRLETTGKRLLKWGLGHGSQKIGAAGDCGEWSKDEKMPTCKIKILMLPAKIRHSIWSRLDNKDILNLRSVSQQMRTEIDHEFGLPIVLNTENDSIYLMQNITTRSCFVTRLDNLLHFNFLPSPNKLKYLRFHHTVKLTAGELDLILRKFPCLWTVSFFNQNQLHEYRDNKMQLVVPTDSMLFMNMLLQKNNIFGIDLKYNNITTDVEWKLEFYPSPKIAACKVGYVHVEMSSHPMQLQGDVLAYLGEQRNLYELKTELVGINWNCYFDVIRQNLKTLTGLYLLSLKCTVDEPFDCKTLEGCENLKFFSIGGENSFVNTNIGGFPYISIIRTTRLTSLQKLRTCCMGKVYLTKNEFSDLKCNSKILIRISQSMIDQKEVEEMKLGFNLNYSESFETNDGEEGDNVEYVVFDKTDVKSFNPTMGLNPALIKGLLITTWLAFC